MKLFCKEDDAPIYTMTIKDILCLDLAMDYVGINLSFRQTVTAIQKAKNRTKMAKLAGLNDRIVGQYTRVLVVVALQQIADILDNESIWAMSLAGDGSAHRDQLFFDLRICVYYCSNLFNLHLVAMPMFERHSVINIFNLIAKFMDALYIKWHAKLIGVSTDGKNTMTGCHARVVTCLVDCSNNDVLRIWCTLHQIDIVVKVAAKGIDNGIWVKQAYMFSVYLRARQPNHRHERQVPKEDELLGAPGPPAELLQVVSSPTPRAHQGQVARPDAVGLVVDHHIRGGARNQRNQRHVGQLQARSFLIGQLETLMQNLLGRIIAM
jgi:hypothetical protein